MIRQRDGGRNQAAAQQMERVEVPVEVDLSAKEGSKKCRFMPCTSTFAERNL